eukprot:1138770-Pelagomonas_calceolata.AAC.15
MSEKDSEEQWHLYVPICQSPSDGASTQVDGGPGVVLRSSAVRSGIRGLAPWRQAGACESRYAVSVGLRWMPKSK